MATLTQDQIKLIEMPVDAKVFLSGIAGSGKTTCAVHRMMKLIEKGVPADSVLVLAPQRTLSLPYMQVLRSAKMPTGGLPSLLTIGGLARRSIDLFWPMVVERAGFGKPNEAPVFLNLETAQYYMARLVRPLLDEGYFESVVIERNRLYSQILDNLNKAAVVGFAHKDIEGRLSAAWTGEPAQKHIFADVQTCASLFRKYCLENNLLDFSLTMELFWDHLWQEELLRDQLEGKYKHLIYDNIEEDVPRAHDLMLEWLPAFDSCLVVHDEGGGFRQFLGADATSAVRLKQACEQSERWADSLVMNSAVQRLERDLKQVIGKKPGEKGIRLEKSEEEIPVSFPKKARFFPEMLDWVVGEIADLTQNQEIPASEIVILAPYLSDALRFAIMERLASADIAARSQRPSRSLKEEPASQAVFCLAAICHPDHQITLHGEDLVRMLFFCIEEMDLVRAQLLARLVYEPKGLRLASFSSLKVEQQERITFALGERYERLRGWIEEYRQGTPVLLDHFMRRLFGEVLSQEGFNLHRNLDAARVVASLIESVKHFRQVMAPEGVSTRQGVLELGREYLLLLQDGVLSAQHLEMWKEEETQAVLVAPAYTFLMMNRPAMIQFWLDPGSVGWVERLNQPLTHPYVLSRNWEVGEGNQRLWTDADEVNANQESLMRLVSGLLHRCRERLYLGMSDLNESGFEQHGAMLKGFQRVFQQAHEVLDSGGNE